MVLLTAFMPLSLLVGGELDFGKFAANLLALALLSAAFASTGLYTSCFASHPTIGSRAVWLVALAALMFVYLAGSAHAFERGWLSLWQLLGGKPMPDGRLPHPLTRDYMYAAGG